VSSAALFLAETAVRHAWRQLGGGIHGKVSQASTSGQMCGEDRQLHLGKCSRIPG
jgi:hypothetical protein